MDPDILEEQLATIQLLEAMYPLPTELVLDPETRSTYDALSLNLASPVNILSFQVILRLRINEDDALPVELVLTLPLTTGTDHATVFIRQPEFLTRSSYEALLSVIPKFLSHTPSNEVVLGTIDIVLQECSRLHAEATLLDLKKLDTSPREAEELERVWFWFPSLSSKDKRQDLVDYAPRYGLTGFVLAGTANLPGNS